MMATIILGYNEAVQLFYDAIKQNQIHLIATIILWCNEAVQDEGLLGEIIAGIAVDIETNSFIFGDKVFF